MHLKIWNSITTRFYVGYTSYSLRYTVHLGPCSVDEADGINLLSALTPAGFLAGLYGIRVGRSSVY